MANRSIRCNDCGGCSILNQKQWRDKVSSYEGATDRCKSLKFKRRFVCRSCKALENSNPFLYQLKYGKPIKDFKLELRRAYRVYHKSSREQGDLIKLQESFNETFSKGLIYNMNLDSPILHTSRDGSGLVKVEGVTIKNYPYVGDYYVPIYTKRGKSN